MMSLIMRPVIGILSLLLVAPAPAQLPVAAVPATIPPAAPPLLVPAWNPGADYVTVGQDEPGYRSWYLAAPFRAGQVKSFNDYLLSYQVSGVVPTWQLLRTASSWQRCGASPFEVPPVEAWPHIVQTLRYVRDFVVPTVGPVEPVSAYRNPTLNHCAGGAAESAHRHFLAVDLVPLWPIARETLMERLCDVHVRRGGEYQVGLGFYAFHRFHVDSMRYRKWGAAASRADSPCAAPLPGAALPVAAATVAPAPTTTAAPPLPPPPADLAASPVESVSQPN